MANILTNLLSPIFEPMGVSKADLTSYIEKVQGHVWAILAVLVVAIWLDNRKEL